MLELIIRRAKFYFLKLEIGVLLTYYTLKITVSYRAFIIDLARISIERKKLDVDINNSISLSEN